MIQGSNSVQKIDAGITSHAKDSIVPSCFWTTWHHSRMPRVSSSADRRKVSRITLNCFVPVLSVSEPSLTFPLPGKGGICGRGPCLSFNGLSKAIGYNSGTHLFMEYFNFGLLCFI